jgi:hypothetical protein
LKSQFGIGADSKIRHDVLAYLTWIDVHVNEFAIALVHLNVSGVPVIEASPHSQDQRGIQKDLIA